MDMDYKLIFIIRHLCTKYDRLKITRRSLDDIIADNDLRSLSVDIVQTLLVISIYLPPGRYPTRNVTHILVSKVFPYSRDDISKMSRITAAGGISKDSWIMTLSPIPSGG